MIVLAVDCIAAMQFPVGLINLGFILLGSLVTYFIFRKTSGTTALFRMPIFLTCAVPLFYMGLASLPFGFEPVFTKIIGHNIRDIYHFPRAANGTEFSESWWLARWQGPLQNVVLILLPIGIVWALVNAALDRQRKANLFAFWTGVAVMVLAGGLAAGIAQLF
jgi:hypothetical protein